MKKTPFIVGNWKMYKNCKEAFSYAEELKMQKRAGNADLAIAAPFTSLQILKEALKDSNVKVFAQNMHFEDKGAYTGEISASMLKEIGVDGVILGHSERRTYFAESNESVLKKALKAISFDLIPIVCVGEGLLQRQEEKHFDFVREQIESLFKNLTKEQASKLVIAYEPIWAIGTGLSASPKEAQEMCAFIRNIVKLLHNEKTAQSLIIQYGGSVKASNAKALFQMPDIDGALVGGASLNAKEFIEIANEARF